MPLPKFLGYIRESSLSGMVLKIAPHHTRQQCPTCHHTSAQNRLTQADFVCIECEYTANADDVGSINVRSRGHIALASRELACEVNGAVLPPAAVSSDARPLLVKQESPSL